ncbi:MAG: dihydropteroate synthase, partial [Burkholderiaceae bacterium]
MSPSTRPAPAASWHAGRFVLSLQRPLVMAVVNLTPASFAVHAPAGQALAQAQAQLKAGADILDLGAESTRPGAQPVPWEQEWQRLQPVLNEAVRWQVP